MQIIYEQQEQMVIQKQEQECKTDEDPLIEEYNVNDQKQDILEMIHTLGNQQYHLTSQSGITNQDVENICAESDLLNIFINTVETTLIQFYVKSEMDSLVELEYHLQFINLQRKFNLAHLARTKSIEQIESKDVDFVAVINKVSEACGITMKETEDILVQNINDLRTKILEYLNTTTAGLENRINNGFEKYIKLWKNDYTVTKKLEIELDFIGFSFTINFAFHIAWDQIVSWCAQNGKVLNGHSFVGMKAARDSTLGLIHL